MDIKQYSLNIKNRNLNIDALKGFAILLVVLGHSIQTNLTNFDDNIIFRVIYSFHMPLFMFLSGFIAYKTKEFNLKLLFKKFKILVIPFISWYLVSYILKGYYSSINFQEYIIRCVKSPDWGLWFLWVVFLCFCVLTIAMRLNKYLGDFSILLCFIILKLIPINIFGFSLLKWHFAFFALGFIVAKYKKNIAKIKLPLEILSIICFPVIVLFWRRTTEPDFVSILNNFVVKYNLHHVLITIVERIYLYIVPIMGIIVSYFIIKNLRKFKLYYVLCWLGMQTLDIYVLHFWFLKIFMVSGIGIIITFIIALAGALAFSFLIRKSKILSAIFLGKLISK